MQKHNRFQKGSGVYKCQKCGKRTRDTGEGAELGYCYDCYLQEEWNNFVSDGGDINEVPEAYQVEASEYSN